MRIELTRTNYVATFFCGICGAEIDEALSAAFLTPEPGDKALYEPADVCPACLDAGPAGAALRARDYAAFFREWAARLDLLAAELETVPAENWASAGDLDTLESEVSEDFFTDDD